jgi:hypothetical protein
VQNFASTDTFWQLWLFILSHWNIIQMGHRRQVLRYMCRPFRAMACSLRVIAMQENFKKHGHRLTDTLMMITWFALRSLRDIPVADVRLQCSYWHYSTCSTVAWRWYHGADQITVNRLWSGGDSLLHVGICCKSIASQMLLKVFKEMEIIGHEKGTARRVVHNIRSVMSRWSITSGL